MKEIVITRVVNAPKESVFKAWTEPSSIKKWWGPKGFSAPSIKVDLRKGGTYLYSMMDQIGNIYWSGGEFIKIEAPNLLMIKDHFSDEKGRKMKPTDYGMDPNFPKEMNATIKFEDEGMKDRTKISIIYRIPENPKVEEAIKRNGMEEGWSSSLDKFQELVEKH